MPIFFVVWDLVLFLALFRFSADSFSNPLVIPQIGKNRSVLSPLQSQVQPVIRGLFRRFGYGLTSIFSGESKKNNFMDFGDTQRAYFGPYRYPSEAFFALSRIVPSYSEICIKKRPKSIFLQFFENFRKNCLFAKKGMPKSSTMVALSLRTQKKNEKKVKSIFRIFFTSAKVAPDCSIRNLASGQFTNLT